MRRSLFQLLDRPRGFAEPAEAPMAALVARARKAEDLGFDTFWLAEHHFQRLGGIPNPAVALAALAGATRRIGLGSAVSVLPLRDPIQLAEDYALVDALSGGRLRLGVGTGGQPAEFAGFGVDFESRGALFEERLRKVEVLWSSAGGEEGDTINVRPVQTEAPIFVATTNVARARELGREGRSMLTIVTPATADLAEVEGLVGAHARGMRDAGRGSGEAEVVTFVFAHVGETEEESRRVAAPALGRLLGLLLGVGGVDGEPVYESMRVREIAAFGTAPAVERMLARVESLGAGHVSFLVGFGGIEPAAVGRAMELLAPTRAAERHPAARPAPRGAR